MAAPVRKRPLVSNASAEKAEGVANSRSTTHWERATLRGTERHVATLSGTEGHGTTLSGTEHTLSDTERHWEELSDTEKH